MVRFVAPVKILAYGGREVIENRKNERSRWYDQEDDKLHMAATTDIVHQGGIAIHHEEVDKGDASQGL